MLQYNNPDIEISLEVIPIEDVLLKNDWGDNIYRIIFAWQNKTEDKANFVLKITRL